MTSTSYYYHKKKTPLSVSEYISIGTGFDLERDEALTRKRPIAVEEMTVRDSEGRRRFHGAYTGGFSAGYFNTCGSEKGWTPATFRSSKGDKSAQTTANPEDYMDEEDLAEYGIAPRKLIPKEGYTSNAPTTYHPTKQQHQSTNSIDNSLVSLLGHVGDNTAEFDDNKIVQDDSIGVKLLKNIGWKEGRGVGELKSIKTQVPIVKTYGCALPPHFNNTSANNNTNNKVPNEIFMLPQDTHIKMPQIRTNLHGLGYIPIRGLSELDLKKSDFKPTGTEKLGIRGQAFGTGVINDIEDDDEYPSNYNDIYTEDNMDNYDYTLDSRTNTNDYPSNATAASYGQLKFTPSSNKLILPQYAHNLPKVPTNYIPKPTLGVEIARKTQKATKKPMIDPLTKSMVLGDISAAEFVARRQQTSLSLQPNENLVEKLGLNIQMKKFVKSGHVALAENDGGGDSTSHVLDHMKKMDVIASCGLISKRVASSWIPEKILCKRFNVPYVDLDLLASQADSKETVHIYNSTANANNDGRPAITPSSSSSRQPLLQKSLPPASKETTSINLKQQSTDNINRHGNLNKGTPDPHKVDTTDKTKLNEEDNVASEEPPPLPLTRPSIDLFKAIFAGDNSDEE